MTKLKTGGQRRTAPKRNFWRVPFALWISLLVGSRWGYGQVTMPADNNKKASVSEQIGITQVTVRYSRPSVNGREGKIWGALVHYGFRDLHYGTSKAAPWRAGANENTTIEFSTPVRIEGQALAAGNYGFFIAMSPDTATLIFSRVSTAWGSFYYDPKDDALRVNVPVVSLPASSERLTYQFDHQTSHSAVLALLWEKVRIPFEIQVDLQQTQLAAFRREVNQGEFYRYWQNLDMAASYCLTHTINLEEALGWSERSINPFFGEANFRTLSTYAGLLAKLHRTAAADSVMAKALPMAKVTDLFQYGYTLGQAGQAQKAFVIWKANFDKNPSHDYAILGMVMGYYVMNKKVEALKLAAFGLNKVQESGFKSYYSGLITKMQTGRSIFE